MSVTHLGPKPWASSAPASSWAPASLPAVGGILAGGSDSSLPCAPLPFGGNLKLQS